MVRRRKSGKNVAIKVLASWSWLIGSFSEGRRGPKMAGAPYISRKTEGDSFTRREDWLKKFAGRGLPIHRTAGHPRAGRRSRGSPVRNSAGSPGAWTAARPAHRPAA